MDIVLYNSVNCELDRVTVSNTEEAKNIICGWIDHGIYGGDKIVFEGASDDLAGREDNE